jgi:hypothetical protein
VGEEALAGGPTRAAVVKGRDAPRGVAEILVGKPVTVVVEGVADLGARRRGGADLADERQAQALAEAAAGGVTDLAGGGRDPVVGEAVAVVVEPVADLGGRCACSAGAKGPIGLADAHARASTKIIFDGTKDLLAFASRLALAGAGLGKALADRDAFNGGRVDTRVATRTPPFTGLTAGRPSADLDAVRSRRWTSLLEGAWLTEAVAIREAIKADRETEPHATTAPTGRTGLDARAGADTHGVGEVDTLLGVAVRVGLTGGEKSPGLDGGVGLHGGVVVCV